MTKNYKLVITEKAFEDLDKLDFDLAERILEKINFYIISPTPLSFAKKLNYPKVDLYRFRVGNYRVIFEILEDGTFSIISVIAVGHRKEIYKHL